MESGSTILDTVATPQLLQTRLCDLGLSMKRSSLQLLVGQLYAELSRKGLCFKPRVWVSTSWFSPYGVPGFAVPFYLFHPRLKELERRYMGEVEGGTDAWFMQLARHETGHAIDNAYLLRLSKRRQELFGLSGKAYPKRYRPDSESKDFVFHLANHYAQAHPDEDWAETFAIWLNPGAKWEQSYKGTKAHAKLRLVDDLMSGIVGKKPLISRVHEVEEISTRKQTLLDYLKLKQHKYRKFAGLSVKSNNINEHKRESWITM